MSTQILSISIDIPRWLNKSKTGVKTVEAR